MRVLTSLMVPAGSAAIRPSIDISNRQRSLANSTFRAPSARVVESITFTDMVVLSLRCPWMSSGCHWSVGSKIAPARRPVIPNDALRLLHQRTDGVAGRAGGELRLSKGRQHIAAVGARFFERTAEPGEIGKS